MILIPVSQSNFWYDHGVSLISAIVTFLAFLLTFGALIYNSRKEKRETENRSKKTLSVLDFIFEKNNDDVNDLMEQIEYIKKRRPEDIKGSENILAYTLGKELGKEKNSLYHINFIGRSITIPGMNSYVTTRYQYNYIVLETYRYLEKNDFISKLNEYENDLKTNLKNQHLNITSDSLGKISERIHAIKESKSIFGSMRITELLKISILEVNGKKEDEISEQIGKDVLDYIKEDYEKVLKLERALQEVIKPLNNGGVK